MNPLMCSDVASDILLIISYFRFTILPGFQSGGRDRATRFSLHLPLMLKISYEIIHIVH